jgi:hypothetical protein
MKEPSRDCAMMTEHQQELYEMLLTYPRTAAARKAQKRSPMEFVIQHGWWYEPGGATKDIEQGGRLKGSGTLKGVGSLCFTEVTHWRQ